MSLSKSDTFDPWNASFEEAQAAQAKVQHIQGPATPIYQWFAAQELTDTGTQTERTGFDVLACVRKCAIHQLVMPEWLADAFVKRYNSVLNCRAGSWDDDAAFGEPYPRLDGQPKRQLKSLRKARLHRVAVWLAVVDAIKENPKLAIDINLFQRIGLVFRLKSTEVQTYYYQGAELMGYGAKGKLRDSVKSRADNALTGGAVLAGLKWGGK